MERFAKCVTLSISGKGNKIFRCEDENPFSENEVENFDELVKNGSIELVENTINDIEEPKNKPKNK